MNNTFSSNSTDWVQFYQRTATAAAQQGSSSAAADDQSSAPMIQSSSASTGHLNPEGRVSKPARRRRASRAAPTTLVNTDTTNFRAMVQQFTGVSNPSLSFGAQNDVQSNIDFRTVIGRGQNNIMPQDYGYRNHFQQQQQQQQRHHQQPPPQPPRQGYMLPLLSSEGFMMGNNSSSSQMFPRSSSSATHNNNGYIQ